VDGQRVDKPGRRVGANARVELERPAHAYVSRGGLKLAHALQTFALDVRGRVAVDLGASTGGFTDCLLQHGASRVYAVDVGRGLLAWRLRIDPRVIAVEGRNARYLAVDEVGGARDLLTVDLAFISLRLVWETIARVVVPGGDVVALVKPQFEAGRALVGRRGVVRDAGVHAAVLRDVLTSAVAAGLAPVAAVSSPVTGPAGNIEYLVHLRAHVAPGAPIDVAAVVADAHARLAPVRRAPDRPVGGAAGRGRG